MSSSSCPLFQPWPCGQSAICNQKTSSLCGAGEVFALMITPNCTSIITALKSTGDGRMFRMDLVCSSASFLLPAFCQSLQAHSFAQLYLATLLRPRLQRFLKKSIFYFKTPPPRRITNFELETHHLGNRSTIDFQTTATATNRQKSNGSKGALKETSAQDLACVARVVWVVWSALVF